MTLNPANGDRSKIVIDSSFGLGETVVGGLVTPDNFVVDKVILDVVKRTISPKHVELVADVKARAWSSGRSKQSVSSRPRSCSTR